MFVYGTFEEEKNAAEAVRSLMRSGFDVRYISALMRTDSKLSEVPMSVESGVRRGAVLGAAFGAAGGALLATGSGLLAAGPMLATLEAAIGGGAAGIVPGGILGLLFGNTKVDFDEERIAGDNILISVNADTRPQLASDVFSACNARSVEVTEESPHSSTISGSQTVE